MRHAECSNRLFKLFGPNFAIHLAAAISGETAPPLSRMQSTGSANASFARVLDSGEALAKLRGRR